jgi:galactan 5-O-arabinofuranosyltransferase
MALLLGVASALSAAWLLRGSPFPLNGLGGDESFRAAAVARAATSWFPADFAYRGLPSFYPPLYFSALGRLVAVSGISTYEALKFGGIVVAGLVPLVTYALWRHLTRDVALALTIAIASVAFHDWYEPYAWIATVAFVPWWFTFVVRTRAPDDGTRADESGRRTGRVVVGSLIGAAIAMTYYYPFFIAALHLAAVVLLGYVLRRRGTPPLRVDAESWMVLAGTVVVSTPYWVPLLVARLEHGAMTSLQNRFFEAWMIPVPLPFFELSLEGLVMLAGLVSLVVLARRDRVALGLLTLVGAAYAWIVVGYVAVLADAPVLAFRAVAVMEVALTAGAGLGMVHLVRARRLPRTWVTAAGGCVAVALVAVAAAGMPYVAEQQAARAPVALLARYDAVTAGGSVDGAVLTTDSELLATRPVAVFNVWNAHYANPFSEFAARSRFVVRLASERDPAVLAAAMRHNRYDRIGAVVLDVRGSHLEYTDAQDAFPRGTRIRTVEFSAERFTTKWFRAAADDQHAVFVPMSADPRAELDTFQRAELRRHFAGDLEPRA